VIDTTTDQEIERIDVRLAEDALPGASPEGVALSEDEKTLYVANAHSNAVAVVCAFRESTVAGTQRRKWLKPRSQKYWDSSPRSVSVCSRRGRRQTLHRKWKRNGIEPSSMRVNNSGRTPNPPNAAFLRTKKRTGRAGNTAGRLFRKHQHRFASGRAGIIALHAATLQNDGLMGLRPRNCLPGRAPSNTWSTSSRRIARTTRFLET